ncbi:hypothetical protein [Streptomyces sp. NPDC018693]|uniref:hypothetical protein n=1 Tax=unclassified Streptomyces TaxID=2593676 RepID=UPI0037AD77E9
MTSGVLVSRASTRTRSHAPAGDNPASFSGQERAATAGAPPGSPLLTPGAGSHITARSRFCGAPAPRDLSGADAQDLALYREKFRRAWACTAPSCTRACATICVFAGAGGVMVRMADDGVGLPAAGSTSEGLGMQAMSERLARVGGRLSVGSNEDGGVTVQARVPA